MVIWRCVSNFIILSSSYRCKKKVCPMLYLVNRISNWPPQPSIVSWLMFSDGIDLCNNQNWPIGIKLFQYEGMSTTASQYTPLGEFNKIYHLLYYFWCISACCYLTFLILAKSCVVRFLVALGSFLNIHFWWTCALFVITYRGVKIRYNLKLWS